MKENWPILLLLILFLGTAFMSNPQDVSQMLPEPPKQICPFEHGYWYCGEGFCIKVDQSEVNHYGII